jgi:hypothetical protein
MVYDRSAQIEKRKVKLTKHNCLEYAILCDIRKHITRNSLFKTRIVCANDTLILEMRGAPSKRLSQLFHNPPTKNESLEARIYFKLGKSHVVIEEYLRGEYLRGIAILESVVVELNDPNYIETILGILCPEEKNQNAN